MPDLESLTLLVVGNQIDNASSLLPVFQDPARIILFADSAQEAIELAKEEKVDVVIILPSLSDREGCVLCGRLRELFYDKPFQIVVVSERAADSELSGFLDAGADDIVRYPYSDSEIKTRVKVAVLRLGRQARLNREKEFFKDAVREEEDVSSRILEKNLQLKRAFENLEIINQELAKVNLELEKVAKHDVLSGLLNRMSLYSMVDAEIERAARIASPLCGVMLDIDHFKYINDNFGHQCGDEVIRGIGNVLLNGLRKYDHAGRYGGEEFFIILPNTNLEQASAIAERFRRELMKHRIACESGEVSLTASLGIALYRVGENKDSWINRADKAMYAAKQRGRNQVVVEG